MLTYTYSRYKMPVWLFGNYTDPTTGERKTFVFTSRTYSDVFVEDPES